MRTKDVNGELVVTVRFKLLPGSRYVRKATIGMIVQNAVAAAKSSLERDEFIVGDRPEFEFDYAREKVRGNNRPMASKIKRLKKGGQTATYVEYEDGSQLKVAPGP